MPMMDCVADRAVSILGLARSPTLNEVQIPEQAVFQYLGSRGAQL